jgi:glycyl-tRNA synthetase
MKKEKQEIFNKVVSLCKRRGFVYPGSDIYGGLANSYDYGPLGVQVVRAIKDMWWKQFVEQRENVYGLDGSIILNPRVWEVSGHVANFTDPLVECRKCHKRFRKDFLDEEGVQSCPDCGGGLTDPKNFNGMFKTHIGASEDTSSVAYLRPETAQAIFINFKNILDSFSPKIPFGVGQIGKSFRNEITAGNFIHRTLEFEQMELEYFIKEESWETEFAKYQEEITKFITSLGIKSENLRVREHTDKERSHYSKKTIDIEYNHYFGWKEIWGLAYRTNYDLTQHAKASGQDLSWGDPETGEKIIPHVIEPAVGVGRLFLIAMLDAYFEEKGRTVLKLPARLSPYKVAIFPLVRNKPDIVFRAKDTYKKLQSKFMCAFDDRGNIGKRYYSQDEIGTPYCVTIDYQTLEDNTVTVRDRDTTKQDRIQIEDLEQFVNSKLKI